MSESSAGNLVGQVEDPRRAEGMLRRLAPGVLFAVLAGANPCRTVVIVIDARLE